MKKLLVLGACVVAFLAFFILVPVVWTHVVPCFNGGYGFASLSYLLFHFGETYMDGQLGWLAYD
jgi:hypothetical protein